MDEIGISGNLITERLFIEGVINQASNIPRIRATN